MMICITFVTASLAAASLSGCGKSKEASLADKVQDLSEKAGKDAGADKYEDESGKSDAPEEAADSHEEGAESDGPAEAPQYCISYSARPEYYNIHILGDDDSYMELSNSLDDLNEDVKEKSGGDADGDSWQKMYVRRNDADILSIACEYRESGGELDYVEMSGHTYDVKTGRELSLSDIVDDEKAFYDILEKAVHDAVMRDMILYAGTRDVEDFDAGPAIEECIKEGRYGWVLDPQGVTFWFRNINALIGHMSATVLFTDDRTGEVFNKDIVAHSPKEWIMQIPGNYITNGFDCDEDGYTDTMEWCLATENDDNGEEYRSGISFYYNNKYYDSSEICPANGIDWYAPEGMLLHRDGRTVLLMQYGEGAEPCYRTFRLEGDTVRAVDSISVYPMIENYSKDESGYVVPDDISAIKVYSAEGGNDLSEPETQLLSVDMDGKITLSNDGAQGKSEAGNGAFDADGIDPESFDPDLLAYKFGGSVAAYECHDYDGDGTKEAFVCMGSPDDMGGYEVESVWFIASDGHTEQMDIDFGGIALYPSQQGYYMSYEDEKKGFFYGECGGYGSGWSDFLFSVKDGKPYELDVSMKIEGFYQEKPGVFYTLTDDFTNGHAYMITELKYDSAAGQFEKGKVSDRNWLEE